MAETKTAQDDKRHHAWHPDRPTLARYRDDELDPKQVERVQAHVSSCASCRTEFLGMCRFK